MKMESEIIIVLLITLIIGGALFYVIRSKKKGKKCIGCPYASSCESCHKKKD